MGHFIIRLETEVDRQEGAWKVWKLLSPEEKDLGKSVSVDDTGTWSVQTRLKDGDYWQPSFVEVNTDDDGRPLKVVFGQGKPQVVWSIEWLGNEPDADGRVQGLPAKGPIDYMGL
jgi:hypothetical protein